MRKARLARERIGLSLEDVSRGTRIAFSHLARFERGEVGLGLAKLRELLRLYREYEPDLNYNDLLEEIQDGDPVSAQA